VVGASFVGSTLYAAEWSGGQIINLGGLPTSTYSVADSINDAGQVVGYTFASPEPSTWATMLLGFAGYRRAKSGRTLAA
jgi:uncharacterized membrane protein